MKANFKPLGLAAAVAAVSAGYTGVAAAQDTGPQGDLALIPYYTVQGDFVTGVHIINTSDLTQVVKLRMRRGSDSMDALDFNLILSPYDVWTGFIDDSSGDIVFQTDDESCTAPLRSNGKFVMPSLYREGAEEGYIEVIAMGSADDDQPIAQSALHADGVPADCGLVAQNFFANSSGLDYGNRTFDTTEQEWWSDSDEIFGDEDPDTIATNTYANAGNALRVSYFIRDAASGLEMGSEAVHVEDFQAVPSMTNQEFGLFAGDVTGFDYPDLNGGVPVGTIPQVSAGPNRGTFDTILRPLLGVETVLNDWSTAAERNVATDWVVTLPGQYTMLDYYPYTVGEVVGLFDCGEENPDDEDAPDLDECDYRDLPVKVVINTWDREEGQISPEDGDLVVSPSIPGERPTTEFEYEVNVIEWNEGGDYVPVLDSDYAISIDTSAFDQSFGWAQLNISANNENGQKVCDWPIRGSVDVGLDNPTLLQTCTDVVTEAIPMVGFIAWERSFPSDPSANYGRIIDHGFTVSSGAP